MESVGLKAAEAVHLKLAVPTGQRTIESDELIPCFTCPCLGMYCSPHHKCGCAANNQCFCLSCKMKPLIRLLKCGKEEGSVSIEIFCFKFVLGKPSPIVSFALESFTPKKRSLLIAKGGVGGFEFEIDFPDGCGCYKPGCSKCFFCCKFQNKCCCCVQQAALPYDSHQACACFGLACLPGSGCCKTVGHLRGKKVRKKSMEETREIAMEMKQASPKSSKKKKKKPSLKPGVDVTGMMDL